MECPEPDQEVELSPETPDTFDVEPVYNDEPLLDERCQKFRPNKRVFSITPNFEGTYTLMALSFRVENVRRVTVNVVSRTDTGFFVRRVTVSNTIGRVGFLLL